MKHIPPMEKRARRELAEIKRLEQMNPLKRWFLYELDPRGLAAALVWILITVAIIIALSHR